MAQLIVKERMDKRMDKRIDKVKPTNKLIMDSKRKD